MDEQPDDRNWFDIQLAQSALPQDVLQQVNFEDELTQFTNEVTTINDINSTPQPDAEDLDPESPECRKLITLRYHRPQEMPVRSSSPVVPTDAPTVEDPNNEVWHETSERSDDEQLH